MNDRVGRIAVVGATIGAALIAAALPARLPQGQWASESTPTVKYMIDMERRWAESGCTNQPIEENLFAEDFQGTAPNGERYNKAQALQTDSSHTERDCHLDEAKVRFFGDKVAVVYGSERALRKAPDGPESMRCLVWTDTWLQRNAKWQIVAVQDTAVPCK